MSTSIKEALKSFSSVLVFKCTVHVLNTFYVYVRIIRTYFQIQTLILIGYSSPTTPWQM